MITLIHTASLKNTLFPNFSEMLPLNLLLLVLIVFYILKLVFKQKLKKHPEYQKCAHVDRPKHQHLTHPTCTMLMRLVHQHNPYLNCGYVEQTFHQQMTGLHC